MKTACLVLASGLSKRFGQDDKLLANLKGQALLSYVLDAARKASFDGYCVIVPDPDPRADLARRHGFEIIENPAPENGQGASLAHGAEYLIETGFKSACILLGDMPMITSDYIEKLQKHAKSFDVTFSQVDKREQPPAIFKHGALQALTGLTGDQGAKNLDLSRFSCGFIELPSFMAADYDKPLDFEPLN